MKIKIGVGLSTYNRPDMALRVIRAIRETTNGVNTVCSIDGGNIGSYNIAEMLKHCGEVIIGTNQGVVRNKNRLLNYLQNCDFIFIIEDDLIPIKNGWVEKYLEALKATGYDHMNFIHGLAQSNKCNEIKYPNDLTIEYYKDLGGALMVMTKRCINEVGIFDPDYKFYGYGHCDYTRRCQLANLYPPVKIGHPHIKGMEAYLKLDIHTSSSTDQDKKGAYIKANGTRYSSGSPMVKIPINNFLI